LVARQHHAEDECSISAEEIWPNLLTDALTVRQDAAQSIRGG
jgi:hypothetical protein